MDENIISARTRALSLQIFAAYYFGQVAAAVLALNAELECVANLCPRTCCIHNSEKVINVLAINGRCTC